MLDELEEVYADIPDFSDYAVTNRGRIYNRRRGIFMSISHTTFGNLKISLVADWDGQRYTRSVAQIVAEAFVEPPNEMCDCVMMLDGDAYNVDASNLVWRPRWFAWKYVRQLKTIQPLHYRNLYVMNEKTGVIYRSIIEAGKAEGVLFDDIWRSTYRGDSIFPNDSTYKIVKRV